MMTTMTTMIDTKIEDRIQRKERDLTYILKLREKWRAHAPRFPHIYSGLTAQGESLVQDLVRLRDMRRKARELDGFKRGQAPMDSQRIEALLASGERAEGLSLEDLN